ncbi:MAG: SpoIID/LytB domain-containing protein, partial [Candidatus Limnocylindrales bacterium]
MSAAAAHALRALPDRRGPASRRAFAGILVLLLAGVGGGLQAPMAVASTTLPTPDPATQIPAAAPLGAAITFYGRGWGHGVGLAQYGARGRATAGQTYSQILAHYYLGTTLGAVDPATPVRVSVLSGWSATAATPLLIYGKLGTWSIDGQADTFPASASLTVAPPVDPATDWHLVVTAADGTTILLDTTVNTEFRVRPVDPTTVLQLYSKPSNYDTYRGVLRVLLGTTTVSVVNELPLESYLRGVIAAEMPASWPAAALWAQAIAARSYGKYQLHPSSGTFDVYDDTRSQVYHGILGETGTTDAAVAGTAGVVALYKGAVIDALFHSSDGGATEDSKNVFTTATGGLGATYPYLSGSSDLDANGKSYDATSPYENWQTATYPLAQLSAMFAADSRTNVGTLTALDLSHRGVSGRLIY